VKCQWFDTDPFESCDRPAAFTCCQFGGHVCERHKCRCWVPLDSDDDWLNAPLTAEEQIAFDAADEEPGVPWD
jgi:hypothetical protein